MSDPITPTRIIPADEPLPNETDNAGGWWGTPVPPPPPEPPRYTAPPPPPVPHPGAPLDVHITVHLGSAEPDPAPSWWQRIRWIYNCGCLAIALPLSGPWAAVLVSVRDEQGLAGAWTIAVVPLAVLGLLDNARRVEAEHAAPDLWAPRIRAALTRTALWATITATVAALPVTTLTYLLTGVRP